MFRLAPVAHAKEVQRALEDECDSACSSGDTPTIRTMPFGARNTPQLVVVVGYNADYSLSDSHEI